MDQTIEYILSMGAGGEQSDDAVTAGAHSTNFQQEQKQRDPFQEDEDNAGMQPDILAVTDRPIDNRDGGAVNLADLDSDDKESEESKSAEKTPMAAADLQRQRALEAKLEEQRIKKAKEEEERRNRELLDAILAQEMQAQFEAEEAQYQQMVDVNRALEAESRQKAT